MVNLKREGLGLLWKLGRAIYNGEDTTETSEETEAPVTSSTDPQAEPMKVYWESDKKELGNNNQPFIDLFLKGVALERIPDATEKPVKESHYKYEQFSLNHLPDIAKNIIIEGNVLIIILFNFLLAEKYVIMGRHTDSL